MPTVLCMPERHGDATSMTHTILKQQLATLMTHHYAFMIVMSRAKQLDLALACAMTRCSAGKPAMTQAGVDLQCRGADLSQVA